MMTPGQPGALGYQVTSIENGQYQQGPSGLPVEGHRVYFQLSGGQSGQVFIPNSQWPDAEAVTALIQQAALHLATISTLTGTVQLPQS